MKNNKKQTPPGDRTARSRRTLRKLGVLFLNFVLIYAAFRLLIELGERTRQLWIYYGTTIVYGIVAVVLFVAYFVLNGFSFNKEPRVWEELPEKWTDEQKKDFMAKQPERKEKAKNLIYIIMPIVVTLMISYVELYFIK